MGSPVVYDGEEVTEYRLEGDESISDAVIRATSALRGVGPCSLSPLADVLDPEARDALFASKYDGTPRTGGRITFVFGGCRVTIEHAESLTLELLETRHANERQPGAVTQTIGEAPTDGR